MEYLIALAIAGHALSFNPTLESVGLNRQVNALKIQIPAGVNVSEFQCRAGVPSGFERFVGLRVWFYSNGTLTGPWLVTDYEAPKHQGLMNSRDILADVDCLEFVHERGELVVVAASRRY